MSKLNIPEGHQAVMPYLMLDNATKFQDFVIAVFDATIKTLHHQPDSTKIMHAEADIQGSRMMFCDSTAQYPRHPAQLFVYVHHADETYSKAIENGASSIMEPKDQDYGRSCGISDICGNIWWITSIE